jgi:hypothetical protein
VTHSRLTSNAARPGSARFALALVAALGFFLQGFIAQTHVHVVSRDGAGIALAAGDVNEHDGKRNPFPGSDDPANCPTCQQLAHAGSYVTPVAAPVQAPSQHRAHAEGFVPLHSDDFILSHAWRSRAPPTA